VQRLGEGWLPKEKEKNNRYPAVPQSLEVVDQPWVSERRKGNEKGGPEVKTGGKINHWTEPERDEQTRCGTRSDKEVKREREHTKSGCTPRP